MPPTHDDRPVPHEQALRSAVATGLALAGQAPRAASTAAAPAPGAIDDSLAAFNTFSTLLATEGIRAALYSVLRKSDYRFIGIFRFRDGKATSAVHVDRMDLSTLQAATVDEAATYCTLVRDGQAPFVTADATRDPRTALHEARDVVRAYAGIPIVARDGEFIGTLCHYDLEPRSPEQLDLSLLLRVAIALGHSGQVPPYPGPENCTG